MGESDIASVISSWTGIPLTKLVASERDSLLRLGDELHRWATPCHQLLFKINIHGGFTIYNDRVLWPASGTRCCA